MRRVPDRIFIAPGSPATSNWAGKWFKTYDLHAVGHCYELCSHGLLWRIDQSASSLRRQVAIHKDLVLFLGTEELVARFSVAAVEWIRSMDELSLAAREFLPVRTPTIDRRPEACPELRESRERLTALWAERGRVSGGWETPLSAIDASL